MPQAPRDARSRAEAILRAAGEPFDTLQPHAGGEQHVLFRVVLAGAPQRLLKLPRSEQVASDRSSIQGLRAEAEALSMLKHVPAPHPYKLLDGAALMGHLAGQSAWHLYERGRISDDALREICFSMGRQLAAIHRCREPQGYEGDIPDLPGEHSGTMRLLHCDYHLGNVQLVMESRQWRVSGVVDWVLCSWGPKEWDFVEMHLSVFRQLSGTREAFLGGYRAGGALPPDLAVERKLLRGELMRRLAAGEVEGGAKRDWVRWLSEL